MAFGEFIKKLTGKIKNISEKVKNNVLPIIHKGAEIVQNTVAPAITSIGEQIGGNFGNTLQIDFRENPYFKWHSQSIANP